MALYFLTLPNLCFCTTWGNITPKIASIHLNAECCSAIRHTKHIHIITLSQLNHAPFIRTRIGRMHETNLGREYSMLPSVCYHTLIVSKVGVVLCRASSENSMDSRPIGGISYYLNNVISCYQTRCWRQYYLPFSNAAHA